MQLGDTNLVEYFPSVLDRREDLEKEDRTRQSSTAALAASPVPGSGQVGLGNNILREGFNKKKSRIRETPTLSTDADSRTDTNLKRLRDLI